MSEAHPTLEYYAEPAGMTASGAHRAAFDDLPGELPLLVRVVRGLTIHEFVATAMYGVKVPDERRFEAHLRSTVSMLDRVAELDARPFDAARAPERRLIGNCHHYAVLLVALLRHHGVPARARWGFGASFNPPYFEDHVNCEVWSERDGRWKFVEPQFDEKWTAQPGFDFDTLDVPEDRFVTASVAWRRCRAGDADPRRFGIFRGNQRGFWFIAASLIKDVAALNKTETLPWDVWGDMPPPGAELSVPQLEHFDRLAELTADPDARFGELRERYERDDGLRVPGVVLNVLRQRQEEFV